MAATAPRNMGATIKEIGRVTKEGRRLKYVLKVIQQPERARACGSGAKSSADRRPVDPPPVVELKIMEIEGDREIDITFSYNANFFLFATLEMFRPIAHGRVQPTPAQIPVLTGMPVSGMAYLDRPSEAGYFIFPDLSVRHEGKYVLSFNLYEETKEAKDTDAEPVGESQPKVLGGAGAADSSFDWRMEVKSSDFKVYSAKKFPGLAESTTLSRTVAEQGCRVRIRRDVRMRRREGKNADFEDDEREEAYRNGRDPTNEPYDRERTRSRSLSNEDERQFFDPQQSRRGSGEYVSPQYGQYAHGAPHPQGQQRFLDFGTDRGQQYQTPQFAHPQAPPPPPPPPAPMSSYAPPQGPFQHQGPQYQAGPPPPPSNYGLGRQYPQSAYPSTSPRDREFEPQESWRRSSVPAYLSSSDPLPRQSPILAVDPISYGYNRTVVHPDYQRSPVVNLAPIKMLQKPDTLSSPSGPLSSISRIAPMLSPTHERKDDRASFYGQYSTPLQPPTDAARNGKRSYDTVFSSVAAASHQPLYNGMRPSSPHHDGLPDDEDEEADIIAEMKMQYKRADGTEYSRELPVQD